MSDDMNVCSYQDTDVSCSIVKMRNSSRQCFWKLVSNLQVNKFSDAREMLLL